MGFDVLCKICLEPVIASAQLCMLLFCSYFKTDCSIFTIRVVHFADLSLACKLLAVKICFNSVHIGLHFLTWLAFYDFLCVH